MKSLLSIALCLGCFLAVGCSDSADAPAMSNKAPMAGEAMSGDMKDGMAKDGGMMKDGAMMKDNGMAKDGAMMKDGK